MIRYFNILIFCDFQGKIWTKQLKYRRIHQFEDNWNDETCRDKLSQKERMSGDFFQGRALRRSWRTRISLGFMVDMWGVPQMGDPQTGWSKTNQHLDDLGLPLFSDTALSSKKGRFRNQEAPPWVSPCKGTRRYKVSQGIF